MRTGLLPVVALALVSASLRVAGADAIADAAAMGYLAAATLAFGSVQRRFAGELHPAFSPASPEAE